MLFLVSPVADALLFSGERLQLIFLFPTFPCRHMEGRQYREDSIFKARLTQPKGLCRVYVLVFTVHFPSVIFPVTTWKPLREDVFSLVLFVTW